MHFRINFIVYFYKNKLKVTFIAFDLNFTIYRSFYDFGYFDFTNSLYINTGITKNIMVNGKSNARAMLNLFTMTTRQ